MFFGELASLGVWIDLYIAEGIEILERNSSFDEETNTRDWFWIWSYQDFFFHYSYLKINTFGRSFYYLRHMCIREKNNF